MRTTRSLVGNLLLTAFLVLIGLGSLRFLNAWGNQTHTVDGWAIALVVAAAVSAGALRWWPLISFAICTVAVTTYLVLGYPFGPILLSLVIATYTLARRERLRIAVIAAVIALPLLAVRLFTNPDALEGFWGLVPALAWIVVPFTVGLTRRLVVDAAERQRAETERRAVDDERLRLASEVHDIVGHGLAAIQMQADIALHVRDRKPEQSAIALEAISRASADALAELRATLAAIAPEGGAVSQDSRAPTPGLTRIADLCARMRESGIHIDLTITGDARTVDPAVGVAAYRVVQESLTNVAKHATERHARVGVQYEPDAVHVEVVNPTASVAPIDEGFGITGMRRRVADVGGEISVTSACGEFRVAAVLPG
ncbi:sensor histidine kinase [Microbacterium sp.]|uniref:sensor histidine kinase n=1 Tax=Microbacterium sp. TaxID=51671 RepID=UPI002D14759F|nr:histidine kinase [Microbacterium sp.]HWK77681.1 histidine kinase [Microbacterium sp.]